MSMKVLEKVPKKIYFGIFSIAILIIFVGFLITFLKSNSVFFNSKNTFPELTKLNNNFSFQELEIFFKDLAEKNGAEYAFNALKIAPLPPNTDIHLLAHTVGNILYKQQGIEGIKICTQDFRNACSHSIVIGVLIDRGPEAINDISNTCKSAPGGPGAYGMCFHGLGHGVLAYVGYDMSKAIPLCEKIGTRDYNFVETSECVGGMIMEMMAGVHDPVAWNRQKGKYFKDDDPLYPCDQSFIPLIAKNNCYNYLSPHLWESAGGDLGNPSEESLREAFKYCSKVGGDNLPYREACYGGFGKEFVGLAQARDIRKIEQMDSSSLSTVYNLCKLADDKIGTSECIKQAANSLYWGGENSSDTVVSFCGVIDDKDFKAVCYEHLVGSFNYYNKNKSELSRVCASLPSLYREKCNDGE